MSDNFISIFVPKVPVKANSGERLDDGFHSESIDPRQKLFERLFAETASSIFSEELSSHQNAKNQPVARYNMD